MRFAQEHINRIADDADFATRVITDALSRAEDELDCPRFR
ncbi:hypothetical protein SMICM304S_08732 [Streptomyces microflavus]